MSQRRDVRTLGMSSAASVCGRVSTGGASPELAPHPRALERYVPARCTFASISLAESVSVLQVIHALHRVFISALAFNLLPEALLPASSIARNRRKSGSECDRTSSGCARLICSLAFEVGLPCRVPRHVDADHAINSDYIAGRSGAQLNACQNTPAPSRELRCTVEPPRQTV